MDRACLGQPVGLHHPARLQKLTRRGLHKTQSVDAATVHAIGVVEFGHGGEQRLYASRANRCPRLQGSLQCRQGDIEQHRERLRRFIARTAQAKAPGRQLAIGNRRGQPCRPGTLRQRVTPVGHQYGTQMLRCERQTLGQQLACAGAQQTQAKNGAAVRVDAARGHQHASFRTFSKAFQNGKRCTGMTCPDHAGEVATQGKQAAHERASIHIGMAAAVPKRHQTRFGLQSHLGVQRAHRSQSNAVRGV